MVGVGILDKTRAVHCLIRTELPVARARDYTGKSSLMFGQKEMVQAVLLGFFLFLASSILLYDYFEAIRPKSLNLGIFHSSEAGFDLTLDYSFLYSILISVISVHLLHELVHGLGYLILTGEIPRVEVKGLALMLTGKKDYVYKRGEYLLIGVLPLILMTLLGCVCVFFVPTSMLPLFYMSLVLNVTGSSADLIIINWLRKHSSKSVVIEKDSMIIVYER